MNANTELVNGVGSPAQNVSSATPEPLTKDASVVPSKVSKKKKKTEGNVIEVKVKHVTVKIYRVPTHRWMSYQVADYSSGKRKLISLSDEKEARRKAQDIAKRLLKGEGAVLKLTNEDQMVYVRASRLAKSVGLPLDVVALHFVESVKILGGDRVIEAAKDFARRHAMNVAPKRVQEVYDELVGDARARKLSERYIEDLEYRCGSFAAACQGNIGEVTGETVRAFLTEKGLGPRSHNNFVRSIKRLFEFAKERKYLPKDHDELDGIGFVKDVGGEIEIFTPDEMVRLLSAAPEHVRVVIAIGGFAGLRSAEMERLDWSEVNLKEGFIKVIAGKGKTASRRIVPISESLAGWLKPSAKESGPVWPLGHAYFYEAMREAARRTKTKTEKAVEWKHNGLRHSFISYRLAETQNVNQVALEAGNSPQMIFQHYRELVTGKEAARWFGVVRESSQTATGKAVIVVKEEKKEAAAKGEVERHEEPMAKAGQQVPENVVSLPGVAVGG